MAKSITRNLGSYLRQDEKLLLSLEEVVHPRQTALVVVDMQNDFVHGRGKSTPKKGEPLNPVQKTVPALRAFVALCRKAGSPVFWIVTHHEKDIDLPAYKALMVRRGALPVCMEGTRGAKLIRELEPDKEERLFIKHGYDGFTGTDLDICLKNRGITTLIMSGVATGTCVAATLIRGFHLGYYVVICPDLTANISPGSKDVFLENFAKHYALVASSKEVTKIWNKS